MENEKGIVKLTRKQLYDEIWALSVAGVARKYNLNYGKLIATCKVENISFPSSGYWTKKNMGKDVSNEIVEFSGLEDTEISLITKDAVVKRIRKAKAEVVEKVHTDVTEELDVAVEEDLSQKKTENIPKWPDGILDYLDATERNKVLEYACNLQISQSTRLHKMLVQYKKDIADYKSKLKEAQSRPYYNPRHNKPENEPAFFKEMSDECMSRAIAILDTVFKSIESLGGSIQARMNSQLRTPVKASNGILVTRFSDHALDRTQTESRPVTVEGILDALKNPLNHGSIKTKTDKLGRPSQQFIGKSATVAVNPENGTITTTWCTGSRTKRKYLKKG